MKDFGEFEPEHCPDTDQSVTPWCLEEWITSCSPAIAPEKLELPTFKVDELSDETPLADNESMFTPCSLLANTGKELVKLRVARLISNLDSVRFREREHAMEELIRSGTFALPLIERELRNPRSHEVERRLRQVAQEITGSNRITVVDGVGRDGLGRARVQSPRADNNGVTIRIEYNDPPIPRANAPLASVVVELTRPFHQIMTITRQEGDQFRYEWARLDAAGQPEERQSWHGKYDTSYDGGLVKPENIPNSR